MEFLVIYIIWKNLRVFFVCLFVCMIEPDAACCCPGDRLCAASPDGGAVNVAGPGTYARGAYIQASLLGVRRDAVRESDGARIVSVIAREEVLGGGGIVLPEVGDVVVCKVGRIADAYAKVQIFCVGDRPLKRPVEGMIRKQDVRAHEIDAVIMSECFLPCDLVRCKVISLGDRRSYFLTTARPELGVVSAKSESGNQMEPVSWEKMVDPVTKIQEKRKVAKC